MASIIYEIPWKSLFKKIKNQWQIFTSLTYTLLIIKAYLKYKPMAMLFILQGLKRGET